MEQLAEKRVRQVRTVADAETAAVVTTATALGNNSNTTWKQQQSQQATFVNPLTNCSAHIAHTQRVHFHFERAAADLFLSFVSFFQALVFVFLFSFYDSQMAINFPCNEHAPRVAGSPAEAVGHSQSQSRPGTALAQPQPQPGQLAQDR